VLRIKERESSTQLTMKDKKLEDGENRKAQTDMVLKKKKT
jgi:hypothetical protein